MVRSSTIESVKNGEISILAILETILAMCLMVWLSVHFGTLKFIAYSVAIAPLLLLRTEKSTELGLRWYYEANVLARALIAPISNFRHRYLQEILPKLHSTAFLLLVPFWILLFCVYIITLSLNIIFRLFSSIPIKIAATLISIITSPIRSITSVLDNWKRTCFVIDCKFPPELVPGIETSSDDRIKSLFSFGEILRLLSEPKDDIFDVLLYCIIFLPGSLAFLPAFLYRYTLKSTSLIYLPLIWIVNDSYPKDVNLRGVLKEITSTFFEKLKLVYSGIVLLAFIVPLYFLVTAQNILGTSSYAGLLNYFFPVIEIDSWHLTRVLGAAITIAVYCYADKMLIRMEHGSTSWQEYAPTVIKSAWYVRKICTFWTIGCGVYILLTTVDWSKVIFKGLPF